MGIDQANQSLIRLMTWLSPAFPVGGFAYSGGLERAVHDGLVADADWLEGLAANADTSGAWWNDAVLLAEAWRARDNLPEISSLPRRWRVRPSGISKS
jgi:urease accessory protein